MLPPATTRGQMRPVNPDSALHTILVQLDGTRLSLADANASALKQATSVLTAEAAYNAARGVVRRESGSFDPEAFFSLNYLNDKEASASFFAGAPVLNTTQTTSTAGLRWDSPVGTHLEATVNAIRMGTNSAFAFLNPQYTTVAALTFRQSLLGGLFVSARKDLAKAEHDMEAARARYDQEVLATTTEVERNYWDLYAAERDFAVQKLTRDRADAFFNDTQVRAKTGLIGPNQVSNARTFLAEQEILLLDSEENLDHLSDQFASLIGMRPDSGKRRFITTDDPPAEFPPADIDTLVARAKESSLQLRAAQEDLEAKRALSSAAFWEALPRVTLVGSLGGNGLAGTAQDVIFQTDTLRTTVGGGFGDALRHAVRRDFPSWSVGVEVSVPLGLRSGLGEQDRLDAEVVMAEQECVRQERQLEELVRASHLELTHGLHRLKAAREGVDAAQEQVRIGLIEFQNGRSTAFELVRLGADFAQAQQRYSQALVRGAKAAASLRQLTSGAYTAQPIE